MKPFKRGLLGGFDSQKLSFGFKVLVWPLLAYVSTYSPECSD